MNGEIMKTVFEKWNNGEITALGNFQTRLFTAYLFADGTNKKRLQHAYPEYFVTLT
jgi:hypothetical protein